MTSQEFLSKSHDLIKLMESFDSGVYYEELEMSTESIKNNFYALQNAASISGPAKIMKGYADSISNVVDEKTQLITNGLKPYQVTRHMDKLLNEIRTSKLFSEEQNDIWQQLIENLMESQGEAYAQKNVRTTLKFHDDLQALKTKILEFKYFVMNLDRLLISQYTMKDNYEVLNIYIVVPEKKLGEFVNVLLFLKDLYHLLCPVFGKNPTEDSLEIRKIETGGIFSIMLAGAEQIVKSIESIFLAIGRFFYDYLTGKVSLAQLESKVIKSRELIALRKFASENEIPEANLKLIDRAIKKSFEQIDKAFPSKTEVVYMNDHKVLEFSEYHQKMLDEGKIKELPENSETASEEV